MTRDVQLSMCWTPPRRRRATACPARSTLSWRAAFPLRSANTRPATRSGAAVSRATKKTGVATHGGSPAREEVTTFFVAGPDVRPGTVHGSRSMVDEAPTMAAMLGLTMPDVDGAPIFEILR